MKTIVVIVSPGGETRVETSGFSGSECHQASRALEAALGITRKVVLTAEHSRPAQGHTTGGYKCDS